MIFSMRENVRTLCFAVALLGGDLVASALTLEHVPSQLAMNLRDEFKTAKGMAAADLAKMANKKWTCDMFGMRTRLQIERGVALYNLQKTKTESVSNTGAQIVKQYALKEKELKGEQGPIVDVIRLNQKGELLAELSLKRKTSDQDTPASGVFASIDSADRVVLAYSVCR